MKKYISIAALLAAGTAFANAGTVIFDFGRTDNESYKTPGAICIGKDNKDAYQGGLTSSGSLDSIAGNYSFTQEATGGGYNNSATQTTDEESGWKNFLTSTPTGWADTFEDGLKIVAERGRLMQEACDAERGAMASLIGGTVEKVQEYCAEFDIDMSNLNCPGQIVISGAADNVARAVDAAKERKDFKMVVPLKVAGAYHSRLMKPARDAFANFIDPFEFGVPNVAVFTNVTGGRVSEPADIKVNLVKQITSTVRWEDCVNNAAKLGIDQFFECGPGGVLAGMMRRINKDYSIRSFAEISDFD